METGKYDVYIRAKKVCHENLPWSMQPQYSSTPQIIQCARKAASFWRENAIAVVIPRRGFSPDVVAIMITITIMKLSGMSSFWTYAKKSLSQISFSNLKIPNGLFFEYSRKLKRIVLFLCVLRHHAAYPSNVQSGKNGGASVNVSLS